MTLESLHSDSLSIRLLITSQHHKLSHATGHQHPAPLHARHWLGGFSGHGTDNTAFCSPPPFRALHCACTYQHDTKHTVHNCSPHDYNTLSVLCPHRHVCGTGISRPQCPHIVSKGRNHGMGRTPNLLWQKPMCPHQPKPNHCAAQGNDCVHFSTPPPQTITGGALLADPTPTSTCEAHTCATKHMHTTGICTVVSKWGHSLSKSHCVSVL